ncbi:MAG: hypothetical protein ACLFPX_08130 [Candidatus Omnitrophota bacterium]
MKKLTPVLILLIICGSAAFASAESLTLTTYYPSPFGSYDRIRLVPHDTATNPITCTKDNEGLLYYDADEGRLRVCGMDDTGPTIQDPGAWTQDGDDLYPTETSNNSNIFVGIGTTTPAARLSVVNGAILAAGAAGATPASGAGTRFMWIPAKSALRAGTVSGTQWHDDNIGLNSVALGEDNTASGSHSFAVGLDNTASRQYGIAMGYGSTASGWNGSIAIGAEGYDKANETRPNSASGMQSTAIGFGNESTGWASTAMGFGNRATATASIALGLHNRADGYNAHILGTNNEIVYGSGYGGSGPKWSGIIGLSNKIHADTGISHIIGSLNHLYGPNSYILGARNKTYGTNSFTIGKYLQADARGEIVLGQYNAASGGSNGSWLDDDPLFVIGNGTSDTSRSNAVTVLKNGNTGIGTSSPAHEFQVEGPNTPTLYIKSSDGTKANIIMEGPGTKCYRLEIVAGPSLGITEVTCP